MSFHFSPLNEDQVNQFKNLHNSLDEKQLFWLAGYLTGLVGANVPTSVPSVQSVKQLSILYGSRTGNGEKLANSFSEIAQNSGFKTEVKNLFNYKSRDFANEKNVIIIVSTHGEGEPPFEAKEFYDFIHSKRAPKLDHLNFAVLGLGDSTYNYFCKSGKDIDLQLEKLGAKRVGKPAFLDVNFKSAADSWIKDTLVHFGATSNPSSIASSTKNESLVEFTAENPLKASVLENIQLYGRSSDRKVNHLEIAAENLYYQAGDALGVITYNNDKSVNELLRTLGFSGDTLVKINDLEIKLGDALKSKFEISKLTVDVLQRFNQSFPQDKIKAVLDNPVVLKSFVYGRDILDLFRDYPVKIKPQQFVEILRPIQPRLYSISSSPNAFPGEVHVTVGVVDYENRGRNKKGACSNYLADLKSDDELEVFISKNESFRLPKDTSKPIIMIGAGTGIAPFRAFIQEREMTENSGKSWLFFGNRHFSSEFLYQTEWQQALESESLTKIDLAFSRDTAKKEYVQHKILQNADEFYNWIQEGAVIYVCGDRTKMAVDVQNAVKQIIKEKAALNEEQTDEFFLQLIKDNRYQTDVY